MLCIFADFCIWGKLTYVHCACTQSQLTCTRTHFQTSRISLVPAFTNAANFNSKGNSLLLRVVRGCNCRHDNRCPCWWTFVWFYPCLMVPWLEASSNKSPCYCSNCSPVLPALSCFYPWNITLIWCNLCLPLWGVPLNRFLLLVSDSLGFKLSLRELHSTSNNHLLFLRN